MAQMHAVKDPQRQHGFFNRDKIVWVPDNFHAQSSFFK